MTPNSQHPITDPTAWAHNLDGPTRSSLRAFAELILGITDRTDDEPETATTFTTRSLNIKHMGHTEIELNELPPVARMTTALAVAELIDRHNAEVGSGQYADPPAWTTTDVGDTTYHHPSTLRAAFPVGTLSPDTACVVAIRVAESHVNPPQITVFVPTGHRNAAREVLAKITTRAAELSPYRGRAVRATYVPGHGLALNVIALPSALSRNTVVVDESVWHEVDLGVSAVRDQHEMLNRLGLGSRRGILLAGPPGVGKSAVSAVVAREVVGTFTVIYVEAKAGESLLTSVVELATHLGGPVCLILEDVDLFIRDRRHRDSTGLSELLQAMDIESDAQILTLASTNDSASLDAAAVRTGRFDSIIEVSYPTPEAAERILAALLAGIPGGNDVDTAVIAARLPERTSGSDLREIVRRSVLSGAGQVTTAALLAEVSSGRYLAAIPQQGQYL